MCERVVMPNGAVAIICGRGMHRRKRPMALKPLKTNTTGGEGGNFELPKAEPHIACLLAIVDMGTQEEEYQGAHSEAHRVAVVWELLDQTRSDGTPFRLAQRLTPSLQGTRNYFRDLCEARLGRKLQEKEEYNPFGLASAGGLVGWYALLNLEHGQSKSNPDRKFCNVKSAGAIPQFMRAHAGTLAPKMQPFLWQLEDGAVPSMCEEVYVMGKKLSERIDECKERRGKKDPSKPAAQPTALQQQEAARAAAVAPTTPSGLTAQQAAAPAQLAQYASEADARNQIAF